MIKSLKHLLIPISIVLLLGMYFNKMMTNDIIKKAQASEDSAVSMMVEAKHDLKMADELKRLRATRTAEVLKREALVSELSHAYDKLKDLKSCEALEKEQRQLLIDKNEQISMLTSENEQLRLVIKKQESAFMAQRVATEAYRDAIKSSKWRNRLEGFVVGVSIGYMGSK